MLKSNLFENKNLQIVILVGGYGKRLGKLTANTPKPLIEINEKPFLEYLVNYLIDQGFKILFLAGFKGIKLKRFIKKNFQKFLKLDFLLKKSMGTDMC